MQPNKEVIRKWVDALRSGKYKQGKGYLHKDDCFCCLGVLCDLAEKEGLISHAVSDRTGWDGYQESITYEGVWDFLPKKVQTWAGLESNHPNITYKVKDRDDETEYEVTDGVSELNDNGFSFTEIADLLEEKYLKGQNNE